MLLLLAQDHPLQHFEDFLSLDQLELGGLLVVHLGWVANLLDLQKVE